MKLFSIVALTAMIVLQLPAQKTKHVVIVVLDGARYTETFGDSSHANIPVLWNEMRPQGTIYTRYYNDGKTETNPGHSSILSGVWQYILNEGSQRPYSPTLFEYFRKEKGVPANQCWVALGKDKLDILSHSTHKDYGSVYGASVLKSSEVASDLIAWQNTRTALLTHRSRLTIANFANIDIEGHAIEWEKYIAAIQRADTLVSALWKVIQSDSILQNKTTMIVTNDHGRHTVDFSGHGDGCEGCRHIMLMILGPDTPKGTVDSTLTRQIDIAPTVGAMMRFSTPLSEGTVIPSALAAAINVPLAFTSPPAGKVSGNVNLQWNKGPSHDPLTTLVEYSRNAGVTWDTLHVTVASDSSFVWNTANYPDGTRYRLRVQVFGDTSYGMTTVSENFTVDNPGNGAPDVSLLSPNRNLILSGVQQIQWSAADPEEDALTISIHGSSDGGTTWQTIQTGLSNTGEYQWNTVLSANSTRFKLRLECSDGAAVSQQISPLFEISNIREKVQRLQQIAGTGDGKVSINVIDPSQLTGQTYRVSFDVIDSVTKRFSVYNVSTSSAVLSLIPFAGDGGEGPLFNGLRIGITDYIEPTHNTDSTGWIKGNSTLFTKVILPEVFMPAETIVATPEAADYEIRISDTIVDTSMAYLESVPTPMYFTVYNTSMNRKTPVVLSELAPNGKLSFGDDLYFFKKDLSGNDVLTWEVFIDGELSSVEPAAGDIYRIATLKPITKDDLFEFTATATSVSGQPGMPDRFALSQNYPNPFNPATAIDYSLPSSSVVTIQIFDLLGREVATLVKERLAPGQYRAVWNATAFASGVYFYRLTAVPVNSTKPNFTQVKKLVLMK
jgi:hypothetical protein